MQSGGIHVQAALYSLSHEGVTQSIYPLPSTMEMQHMCVKFSRDLVPVYFWGGLCRYSSMYQNSTFPEGKRVFSINNIVCTNNLGATGHHYQLGIVGIFLKSKFLVTSQRPALLTGLSEDSSLRSSILTFSAQWIIIWSSI